MKLQFRNNGLELEGYINVTERNSELLTDKDGKFIEVVKRGVWSRAIKQRTINLLYNHNTNRKLGDTNTNLELTEDSIGCKFRAFITDADIIERAKKGLLKSCSFGFIPVRQAKKFVDGIEHRYLEEIELFEVSLLDIAPAYSGCSINIRSEEQESEYLVRAIDLEEIVETEESIEDEVEKIEEELELTQAEAALENVDDSEEEIIEAQEEILEQQYDKLDNLKMWLWLQNNKRA